MKLDISFRHMDHTESIDAKIREKFEKFAAKHLSTSATVQWTCLVEHDEHQSSVHVSDRGHCFHVKAGSENMYKTIDQVLHKLNSQMEAQGHHPGI